MDVNKHLESEGFEPTSKDAVHAKIRRLEDSFKKALTWINSTGAGSYSLEPEEEGDGRSPYQRELDKRCKCYKTLLKAFGERAGMIPKRVYTSLEAKDNAGAERDVLCALGIKKWDWEEDEEEEKESDGDEVMEAGGNDHSMETPTPASKGKKRDSSSQSASTSRSSKSARIVKSEDISSYLEGKRESDSRRLDIEERKLKVESKKARLEGIAMLVKAGVSLEDAKKTWDEEVSDGDE